MLEDVLAASIFDLTLTGTPMSPYAAAIFDLDGTLIVTERLFLDAALDALARAGGTVTREFMTSLVGVADSEA